MTHTAADMDSDNGELPKNWREPGTLLTPEEVEKVQRLGPGGIVFQRDYDVKAPPVEMTVMVPAGLSHLVPDLKRFVDAMVYKLNKNSHKGKWEDSTIDRTLQLLKGEVDELTDAIAEGNDIEIVLEAADIGNFAMIAASIAVEGRKR